MKMSEGGEGVELCQQHDLSLTPPALPSSAAACVIYLTDCLPLTKPLNPNDQHHLFPPL